MGHRGMTRRQFPRGVAGAALGIGVVPSIAHRVAAQHFYVEYEYPNGA